MRRRWGTGRLVVTVVAVALIGALVLLRQPLGRFLLAQVLARVEQQTGARVELGSVEGDIYRSPRFRNVRATWNGDSATATELTFSYDLLGLLRGRIPVSRLRLVRPRVFLGMERPVPESAAAAPSRLEFPKLNLGSLTLVDGELFLDGERRLDSVEVELAVTSVPDRAELAVGSVAARLVREQVCLRRLAASAYATPESLVLTKAEIATDRSSVSGDFRLRFAGPGIEGRLEQLRVELGEFSELGGTFEAQGTAEVDSASRAAALSYQARGLELGGLALPALDGRLTLKDDELDLAVSGQDKELGQFSVIAAVDLAELRYAGTASLRGSALRRLHAELPDERVDADLVFSGVKAETVNVSLQGKVAGLGIDTLRGAGVYTRGRVTVDELTLDGAVGRVWASGSFAAGQARGRCLLDSLDLGLGGRFLGESLEGRVSGVVSASGNLDSLAFSGGLSGSGFRFADVGLERLAADFDAVFGSRLVGRVAVGAEEVRIGEVALRACQLTLLDSDLDLRMDRDRDRLLIQARADVARDSLALQVGMFEFATATETLGLTRPFRVAWRPSSLVVTGVEYEVADGTVRLDVNQLGAAGPEVSVRADSINLRKLQKLLGVPFEVWGTVDLAVSGRDTLRVALRAQDLEVPDIGLRLKFAHLAAALDRDHAELERLELVHAAETSQVSGTAAYSLDPKFTLGNVDLRGSIADPGPWLLFFLEPTLRLERGKIYGQLTLTGEVSRPNFNGRARVVRGVLNVPAINTAVENVNAELTMHGGRITLEKLSGGAGTGIVTAQGFVDLGQEWLVDSLRYTVRTDKATVNPIPEVVAVATGAVELRWGEGRPFSIDGDVNVEEALLAFGFGQSAPRTSPSEEELDSLVYDIRVRGDRDIWLRNQLVDIELSVDMALRKTMDRELYVGELTTRQGNVYYLDHTLRVTRGRMAFQNIERLNPSLDIVAELPVRGQGENLPDKVLLTLGGTLEKPEFRFSSEPAGWDENEIITYLTLNVTTDELSALENREEVARYLSGRLLGIFQTQVTKQVRKWISLDALSFESELTGGEGYKVTVGKYVGPNLYVTYIQNFTGDVLPEFRVEYYLDQRNEIVGARNEDGRFSVLYRFRLRY